MLDTVNKLKETAKTTGVPADVVLNVYLKNGQFQLNSWQYTTYCDYKTRATKSFSEWVEAEKYESIYYNQSKDLAVYLSIKPNGNIVIMETTQMYRGQVCVDTIYRRLHRRETKTTFINSIKK